MQQKKDRNDNGKKYVLLLDENFTFRYYLSKGLRAHGYTCFEAWEYKTAESGIQKNIFDLVLADYRTFMNNKAGTCLHESRPLHGTPIIFLMGQATDESMETAKMLGAKAIFEKRGDLNDLLEKINLTFSSGIRRSKT